MAARVKFLGDLGSGNHEQLFDVEIGESRGFSDLENLPDLFDLAFFVRRVKEFRNRIFHHFLLFESKILLIISSESFTASAIAQSPMRAGLQM